MNISRLQVDCIATGLQETSITVINDIEEVKHATKLSICRYTVWQWSRLQLQFLAFNKPFDFYSVHVSQWISKSWRQLLKVIYHKMILRLSDYFQDKTYTITREKYTFQREFKNYQRKLWNRQIPLYDRLIQIAVADCFIQARDDLEDTSEVWSNHKSWLIVSITLIIW